MIIKYKDHAANERTYLAWLRTAIALMTFGFLIEKFELFLNTLTNTAPAPSLLFSSGSMQMVGAGLFILGLLVIISATVRFFISLRNIESDAEYAYSAKKIILSLSVVMACLALFLLFYIGQRVMV